MKVVALTKVYYENHEYDPGEEFDVKYDIDAQGMIHTGKAKAADGQQQKAAPPNIPIPPAVSHQPLPEPKQAEEHQSQSVQPMTTDSGLTGEPKRTYRRRDMKPTE